MTLLLTRDLNLAVSCGPDLALRFHPNPDCRPQADLRLDPGFHPDPAHRPHQSTTVDAISYVNLNLALKPYC